MQLFSLVRLRPAAGKSAATDNPDAVTGSKAADSCAQSPAAEIPATSPPNSFKIKSPTLP